MLLCAVSCFFYAIMSGCSYCKHNMASFLCRYVYLVLLLVWTRLNVSSGRKWPCSVHVQEKHIYCQRVSTARSQVGGYHGSKKGQTFFLITNLFKNKIHSEVLRLSFCCSPAFPSLPGALLLSWRSSFGALKYRRCMVSNFKNLFLAILTSNLGGWGTDNMGESEPRCRVFAVTPKFVKSCFSYNQ